MLFQVPVLFHLGFGFPTSMLSDPVQVSSQMGAGSPGLGEEPVRTPGRPPLQTLGLAPSIDPGAALPQTLGVALPTDPSGVAPTADHGEIPLQTPGWPHCRPWEGPTADLKWLHPQTPGGLHPQTPGRPPLQTLGRAPSTDPGAAPTADPRVGSIHRCWGGPCCSDSQRPPPTPHTATSCSFQSSFRTVQTACTNSSSGQRFSVFLGCVVLFPPIWLWTLTVGGRTSGGPGLLLHRGVARCDGV